MSDMDRLAASMYGSNRLEETASLVSLDTQTYIGIAKADSEEGLVEVVLSDDVTQPDGGIWDGSEWQGEDDIGTSVTLPTTQSVREGERVLVSAFGGNTIATPVVTGVIGGGDSLRQDVEAVNQYFWTDEDGVHVTQIPQDEFVQSPSGPNQLSNSEGILLRDGETNLSAFTPDGVSIYDGQGNEDYNVVAEFTSDGARVGYERSSNVSLAPEGMTFNNYAGLDVGAVLSNGGSTQVSTVLPFTKTGLYATYQNPVTYTFEARTGSLEVSQYKVSLTLETSYASDYWHGTLVFDSTFASWPTIRTVFYEDPDIIIYAPTVEPTPLGVSAEEPPYGFDFLNVVIEVKNAYSGVRARLLESAPVTAIYGMDAPTYRFGSGSATGEYAFAEGSGVASREYSHAQNRGTIAASMDQTVLGAYNVADSSNRYAVIVGNGSNDSARSNALLVDWSGNVTCGTVNGIDIASAITGATQFQGELDSQSTLEEAEYKAGWFWVVTAAGTYAGNVCEHGDMVYAIADKGEAYAASDFVVVQANLGPATNLSNIDIDQICV